MISPMMDSRGDTKKGRRTRNVHTTKNMMGSKMLTFEESGNASVNRSSFTSIVKLRKEEFYITFMGRSMSGLRNRSQRREETENVTNRESTKAV